MLSAAVGLGLTLVAPIALYWIARGVPAAPSLSLLAAPLLLSIPLVAGLRVVVAMPSELTARWVFRAAPTEGFAGRAAVWRFIFALGVLVPVVLFAPAWIAFWGITTAWQFVVNALLAGAILVDAHIWGFAGMPCTRPLSVSDSNLQGRWPFYGVRPGCLCARSSRHRSVDRRAFNRMAADDRVGRGLLRRPQPFERRGASQCPHRRSSRSDPAGPSPAAAEVEYPQRQSRHYEEQRATGDPTCLMFETSPSATAPWSRSTT